MEVCTWHCPLWPKFPAEVAEGEFPFISHLIGTILSSSMFSFLQKNRTAVDFCDDCLSCN